MSVKMFPLYEIVALVGFAVFFVVYLIVSRNEGSEDKLEYQEGGEEE